MAETVSGPGRMARRTDLNNTTRTTQGAKYMRGGQYGEGQELMALQTSAALKGAPVAPQAQLLPPSALAAVTPLTAETQRPEEFPTTGAPFGPGPGPEILNTVGRPNRSIRDILAGLVADDELGEINALYEQVLTRGL